MKIETNRYPESNGKLTRMVIVFGGAGRLRWYFMVNWLGRKVQTWNELKMQLRAPTFFLRVHPLCISAAMWKRPKCRVTPEGIAAIQKLLRGGR